MKCRAVNVLLLLFLLLIVNTCLVRTMFHKSAASVLLTLEFQSEVFRSQQLSEKMLPELVRLRREDALPIGEILTVLAARGERGTKSAVAGRSAEYFVKWKQLFLKNNPQGFTRVSEAYGAIWNDLVCFPLAKEGVTYENSWMFERTYGGVRGHEGTDLIPPQNLSGYYRILSMTNGVVEEIGWLPLGGYRIGIRSPSGGYFYYAHLESYSRSFSEGEAVEAGDVLGTMGDTGYGPEGTRGRFPVHLHLGIYIRTEDQEELSVNPYWILRYLQAAAA